MEERHAGWGCRRARRRQANRIITTTTSRYSSTTSVQRSARRTLTRTLTNRVSQSGHRRWPVTVIPQQGQRLSIVSPRPRTGRLSWRGRCNLPIGPDLRKGRVGVGAERVAALSASHSTRERWTSLFSRGSWRPGPSRCRASRGRYNPASLRGVRFRAGAPRAEAPGAGRHPPHRAHIRLHAGPEWVYGSGQGGGGATVGSPGLDGAGAAPSPCASSRPGLLRVAIEALDELIQLID